MKVRQFRYAADENSPLLKETERELNGFLRGVQVIDVQYSGVSGINALDEQHTTGIVLVRYENGTPKPKDIVQMKQFPLGSDRFRESIHKNLNDFLVSKDVKDVKYAAVSERNLSDEESRTGLVLVIFRPTRNKSSK